MALYNKAEDNQNVTINSDLLAERRVIKFDLEELTLMLHGGKSRYEREKQLLQEVFEDPLFHAVRKYGLSNEERYELSLKRAVHLLELTTEKGWDPVTDLSVITEAIHYDIPMMLHHVMFIPTIQRLGTDVQKAKWLPLTFTLQIIGTYAQTELGHGTYLKGLETTATYDPKTQEFILSTPLPSGMKWWPGGLGQTSNHCLVMANLILQGKSCGMQAFMCPIRDCTTHEPLQGVEVGTIGHRLGLKAADNGYLILRDVRIPRDNMLMKYDKVTPAGDFITSGAPRANYGTMMMIRANLVRVAYCDLSQSCTIATRYSAVRRQSELEPGGREPQVLDYQTQQYKVIPNIALSYALYFVQQYMSHTYHQIFETELSKGNFSNVAELHSQSAGLKAYCTDLATEGIEVCRRACGGHGYMENAGIGPIYLDALSSVTYEGENTVMYLQTARYLVKSFASAAAGEPVTYSVKYLMCEPEAPLFNCPDDCLNLNLLQQACFRRAYFMVEQVSKHLQRLIEAGHKHYLAWNQSSVYLMQAVKAHLDSFVVVNFIQCTQSLKCSKGVQEVLLAVCQLHAIHRILHSVGEFLQSGAISFDQVDMMKEVELQLLAKIRTQAVGLVDAFGWHDETLGSALGRYDGNVYETLYKEAKTSSLNKNKVNQEFLKYFKPLQHKARL